MQEAIALSRHGMENNHGGPFGCIIVKDDEIVGRGNNQVTSTNDPTAHAEVVAIRDACRNLGTFQLDDCEVYTKLRTLPMCLGHLLGKAKDHLFRQQPWRCCNDRLRWFYDIWWNVGLHWKQEDTDTLTGKRRSTAGFYGLEEQRR